MRFFPAPLLQNLVDQDRPLNVAADRSRLKEVQHRGGRELAKLFLFSGHVSGCLCFDGQQTPVKFALTGAVRVDRLAEGKTLRFTEGGYLRLAGDE
jgi:hypothetical protein